MKAYLSIEAKKREVGKKSIIKALLKQSVLPGVIYLKNGKNENISISFKDANAIIADPSGLTRIYEIDIEGKKHFCLLKDMQFNVSNDTPYHCDFMEVKSGDKVKVSIPVRVINKEICPGVKNGGDVYMLSYNVRLKCDVEKIPYALEIDVKDSNVGTKFFLSDIKIPEGCEIIKNVILARVAGKRVIKEEATTTDETATSENTTAGVDNSTAGQTATADAK